MLNILEVCVPKLGLNLATLGPANPTYWHLMVEAKKLAYADLLASNGDPSSRDVPVAAPDLEGARRHAVRSPRCDARGADRRARRSPTAAPST